MTRTEQVYAQLKAQIEDGAYRPSESLPEIELATKFHVSRNTVKKALLMLERENYVIIEKNRGAKVRAYSLDEVLEYLEIRARMEGFIAFKATPHMSEDHLARMHSLLERMKQSLADNELIAYSKLNREFHEIISEACPNKTAVAMTRALKLQMSKYNTKTILIPGRDQQSFAEHRAVYEALRSGDAARAEALIIAHIDHVRETFRAHYTLLF